METRPAPEETRPPLTPVGRAWRLLVCLLISAIAWVQVAGTEWSTHRGWFWIEVGLGVLAYLIVPLRRAAPLPVALLVAALTTGSGIAAGPAALAAVSVATLRRPVPVVAVGLANLVCAQAYVVLSPLDVEISFWIYALISLVFTAAMMGWGLYIGARREVIWTLRARATRAEEEQDLRVGQARATERQRIAREMHDVLAHRITQVSMQAGALTFREDLDAARLREGLGQIQQQANSALHELRGVLGVLRSVDDSSGSEPGPQPRFVDIADLVEQARAGGMNLTYTQEVDEEASPIPDATGRTLYRIVQEGITNARKHAPGALLTVTLRGSPETGVDVTLRNRLGFNSAGAPGSGLGLVGLRERAGISGGHLDQYRDGSSFVLHGWIPWAM